VTKQILFFFGFSHKKDPHITTYISQALHIITNVTDIIYHGKGDDVHGRLISVNGAMTSPCAAPRHTAKMKVRRVLGCGHTVNADGVELQRTTVNVEPISPWAV